LIFNYGMIIVPLISDLERFADLRKIANNWEGAMLKLDIPVEVLTRVESPAYS